jgi:hypothetical protein
MAETLIATGRPGDTTPSALNQQQQKGTQQASRPELPLQSTESVLMEHDTRQESNNTDFSLFTTWDEMGLGQEEFGFLGRFDLPDLASWFTDIPS